MGCLVDKTVRMNSAEAVAALNRIARDIEQVRVYLESKAGAGDAISLPADAAAKLANRICLNCGKVIPPDEKVVRGCDVACRQSIRRAIREGKMTEEAAIENGILAPPGPTGRRPRADTRLAELIDIENETAAEIKSVGHAHAAKQKADYKTKPTRMKKSQ